jgi:sigma-B regulation protein RsbU (phosphoserine phosphatase)
VHLRDGRVERIENNGMLIGVLPEPDYPVCKLRAERGDRFLLYTDGVTAPENDRGEAFGETRLEEVVRASRLQMPAQFVAELLHEIRCWQPDGRKQQDDITIVVVDMIAGAG